MPRLAPHKMAAARTPLWPPADDEPGTFARTRQTPWAGLDEACTASFRARVEARKLAASSVANIEVVFNPHGREATVKARSLVAVCNRAMSRLQSAMEHLEVQAGSAQAMHDADEAEWVTRTHMLQHRMNASNEATARTFRAELQLAELDMAAQRDALTRLLADELKSSDAEHERHVRALRSSFDAERSKLLDEGARLRARLESTSLQAAGDLQTARMCAPPAAVADSARSTLHLAQPRPASPRLTPPCPASPRLVRRRAGSCAHPRVCPPTSPTCSAHDDLSSEAGALRGTISTLRHELVEERAARTAEQQAAQELKDANAKLRAELGAAQASLEHTRVDLLGQVERLSREKQAGASERDAQLDHLQALRDQEAAHLRRSMHHAAIEAEETQHSLREALQVCIPPCRVRRDGPGLSPRDGRVSHCAERLSHCAGGDRGTRDRCGLVPGADR